MAKSELFTSKPSCLFSAVEKAPSKKALKKQQKEAEKAKRKAEVAAKLVREGGEGRRRMKGLCFMREYVVIVHCNAFPLFFPHTGSGSLGTSS